jgi:hypothetical protein
MKFVSKQGNYRIVLKQGQPAEPLTGRIAVPGIYIKFENGIANVSNEEMITLMMNHSAYNRDFICAEEGIADPWGDFRKEKEPQHTIMNIKHGEVEKNLTPKAKLPVEQQKIITEMAAKMAQEMAQEMAPKLAKELLDKMIGDAKEKRAESVQEESELKEPFEQESIQEESKVNEPLEAEYEETEKSDSIPESILEQEVTSIPEVDKTIGKKTNKKNK